jgi:hypothetical protein
VIVATNRLARSSWAREMDSLARSLVAPLGRLWYNSASARLPSWRSVPQSVRYGYDPRVTRPSGERPAGQQAKNW